MFLHIEVDAASSCGKELCKNVHFLGATDHRMCQKILRHHPTELSSCSGKNGRGAPVVRSIFTEQVRVVVDLVNVCKFSLRIQLQL